MFQGTGFSEPEPRHSGIYKETPQEFLILASILDMPEQRDWRAYREMFIERWGRKPDQERWQMPEVQLSSEKKKQLFKVLDQLGVISAWMPLQQDYHYAILPGSTLPNMMHRLDWLAKLWTQGHRFDQLVVLTGQRPLTHNIDRVREVFSMLVPTRAQSIAEQHYPLHETEAARLLLHYYSYPEGMEHVPVKIVDSPRKWQNHSWHRSHTTDTVESWLEYNPKPGSVLMITNQPSAHYQSSAFNRALPDSFHLDTSAPAVPDQTPVVVILDGISTWLRASQH